MKKFLYWWKHRAQKTVTVSIVTLHVLAIFAFYPFFSWSGFAIFLALYFVTACLGITLCFHRLLTHRSFKTPKWFERFLILCGCLAWQGSPISWIGTHRAHHAHSDQEGDPHTPQHGFNWAHVLWTFNKEEKFDPLDYCKDLQQDSFIMDLEKWFWLPQITLTLIVYDLGYIYGGWQTGISWILWGTAIRTVAVFHATWFVNSASHTWGYRNYSDTKDNSRNLWWVAILSFGEGWHNNHHKFQTSAAHGLRWFEIDPTYLIIKLLEKVKLASKIKLPKEV